MRPSAVLSVLVPSVLVLSTIGSANLTAATAAPDGDRYVALGDSFVAGPGIRPVADELCERSAKNLPSLVAAQLQVESFTDASCSGAVTANYWTPQVRPAGTHPPQLDAIGPDTTLVTLGTLGGNDVGLIDLAVSCVFGDCTTTSGEVIQEKADALAAQYRRVIDEIRVRAPRATLVAVGYGTYMPAEPCASTPGMTEAELRYFQGAVDLVSDVIGQVAAHKQIAFADMRRLPWQAHTPCAAPEQQWIRGADGYDDGVALHPSAAGMAQMAGELVRTIETARDARFTPPATAPSSVSDASRTVRLRAKCLAPGPGRRVALRVVGGRSLVTTVRFRVGPRWSAVDRSAPFAVVRRAKAFAKVAPRGPFKAVVTLRSGADTRVRVVTPKRPRCLR